MNVSGRFWAKKLFRTGPARSESSDLLSKHRANKYDREPSCQASTGQPRRCRTPPHHSHNCAQAAQVAPSHQTSGLRCLLTDTSCPVIFKLPAFPVPPTRTLSSNSPPIFWLHFTQTSVSGMTSSRSRGISTPHLLQCLASVSIRFSFLAQPPSKPALPSAPIVTLSGRAAEDAGFGTKCNPHLRHCATGKPATAS